MTVKVDLIVAARPNFMKVAPLYHALACESTWCRMRIVHTGQHYDMNMSGAFLRDLGLPEPHAHLGVGSGTHAEQTAGVMVAYEKACKAERPDWVIVVGDVNSTLACAVASVKQGIRVAHLEAGLRSRDRSMPEEINRVLTDSIADLLWTPSADADENLLREGIAAEKIGRVGNIMIDSLEMMRPRIERAGTASRYGLQARKYGVVTLHRPSNVDDAGILSRLANVLIELGGTTPIIFPVHPRTRSRLEAMLLWSRLASAKGVHLADPENYIDFMNLVFGAAYVLTDSGGLQEETTYLGIPCLTLRENTERPVTVKQGTNRLVNIGTVEAAVHDALSGRWPRGEIPPLWDGRTSARVVASLKQVVGA